MTVVVKNEENFTEEQLKLIKEMYAPSATPSELLVFGKLAKRANLDPFSRQIFPVKRFNSNLKKEQMTVQTGIEGYRLIADRTGNYAPGKDCEFGYSESGQLQWAKSYVKKRTPDGAWHEFSHTAFWEEYAQFTKSGQVNSFWSTKPKIMLAKCAEAAALRKGFPQELSGLYIKEEMDSQDIEEIKDQSNEIDVPNVVERKKTQNNISEEKIEELNLILKECSVDFLDKIWNHLKRAKISDLGKISQNLYSNILNAAIKNKEEQRKVKP